MLLKSHFSYFLLSIFLFIYFIFVNINLVVLTLANTYKDKVAGVCGRPNLPLHAHIRHTHSGKVKFAENETVYIQCEENQFPHHTQNRTCKHGQWLGPQARCGKPVGANVVQIKVFKCEDTHNAILSLDVNQTEEKYALPTNSFHFTRVKSNTLLSVFGSNCYRWILKFERAVEIAFLLIDLSISKMINKIETPIVNVSITHRICMLQTTTNQTVDNEKVFGSYFFCDLKTNQVKDVEIFNTKYLVMDVQTSTNKTISLDAVFVGETYKKVIMKSNTTDCGKMEIQRTGILEQTELAYTEISCNDSFIENGGIKKHKFECDSNGQWQGEWPVCIPKKTCSKKDITTKLPSSIVIEQIGNVYYINDSDWYAIDHSWVRYACANLDSFMIGKNDQVCSGGTWTNKVPQCTHASAIQQGSFAISFIMGIFIAFIAAFSLIVYLNIKKVYRKLKTTKNELQANAQLMCYSDLHSRDSIIYDNVNKDIQTVPLIKLSDKKQYEEGPIVATELMFQY